MNDSKLKLLVTEAVSLDRKIAELTEELKAKKAALAAEADLRAEDATPTEGGGTSLIFEGADGCICRVTTAGRTLKASLGADSKELKKARVLCGKDNDFFGALFTPAFVYKPAESFRERALQYLGKADAAKLIKLCETGGKTTVSFETKEAAS